MRMSLAFNVRQVISTDKEKKKEKNVGERGYGMTASFLCCALDMVDSVLSCLT